MNARTETQGRGGFFSAVSPDLGVRKLLRERLSDARSLKYKKFSKNDRKLVS
jgi:hypothetical protein